MDYCVSCGGIIPEGSWVCPNCSNRKNNGIEYRLRYTTEGINESKRYKDGKLLLSYIQELIEKDLRVGQIFETVRFNNGDLFYMENDELLKILGGYFKDEK